jgi:hypothetical protein
MLRRCFFFLLDRLFFLGLLAFPAKNLALVGVEGCTIDNLNVWETEKEKGAAK